MKENNVELTKLKMRQPADDRNFIFAAAPMLANRLQVVGSQVTEAITFKQWLILLIVREMPAKSTVSEIAKQYGSSRQNAKKLLDSLAKIEYVLLEQDPEDKRSYAVSITQRGKKFMKDAEKPGNAFVNMVFEGCTENDIAATKRVIMQTLINLDSLAAQEGEGNL